MSHATNYANGDEVANKLSGNICRLLFDMARDFDSRALQKLHARGHHKVRSSHNSLFSNLGYGAVRLTELAERARITQQAMGKLVKEMERVGYVQRHVDESDKRAKIIQLTERGVTLVQDSMESVDEIIEEYCQALGDDGVLELESVLRNAANKLELGFANNRQRTNNKPATATVAASPRELELA